MTPSPRRYHRAVARHRDEERNVRLSQAAQGYLLALRSLTGEGAPTMISAVARGMGVSTQAASEMVARLTSDGLAQLSGERELSLTGAGRAQADAIFRRHALLEWLLIYVIGLGWAESDEEAMRLQGAISPRVEERLAELLGHPPTCPHGNPIDLATARSRPPGVPLSQAEPGTEVTIYRITEEAEEDADLLAYFERERLFPGTAVRIVDVSAARESLTLEGPRGEGTLGLRPAGLVRILPGRADPSLFHRVPRGVAARIAGQPA